MQKSRKLFIVVLTFLVGLVLLITIFSSVSKVNEQMTEYSFGQLKETTNTLADDFVNNMNNDRTLLEAAAMVISSYDELTDENLYKAMNDVKIENSYMSRIELLDKSGRLMGQDKTVSDVSDKLDFDEEVKKGEYISEKQTDLLCNDEVVKNCVPVIKDGEAVAVLYGVISLDELAEIYHTDIYDGNANVYIVDGDTGDFLLDSGHKTLGNVSDFTNRQVVEGESFETLVSDLKNGTSGKIGFISQRIDKPVYMQYIPVGLNNWSVMVSVDKDSAFATASPVTSILYVMSIIVGGVLLIYIVCVSIQLVISYKAVYRKGIEDQTTHLKNRNAYEQYISACSGITFESVVCIYLDANGLHELNNTQGHDAGDAMLVTIANCLKQEFVSDNLFRVGGDEFVVVCENAKLDECEEKAARAVQIVQLQGYSVSYGVSCGKNEMGLSEIIHQADEAMLENKRQYYSLHDRRAR